MLLRVCSAGILPACRIHTEQILNQKKEMHLSAFKFCLDEMAIGLASKEIAFEQRLQRDPTRFRSDCPTFRSSTSKIREEARGFLARASGRCGFS